MSAPSMTRLVEILEEAGWVERRRDPADQRCLLLVLSPVGRKTIETLRDEAATQLSEELTELTADERADPRRRRAGACGSWRTDTWTADIQGQ